MKRFVSILLALLLTVASISTAFACEDDKDKGKDKGKDKKDYTVVNVNDNVKGNGYNEFQYAGDWNYGGQKGAYSSDNHWSRAKDSYYKIQFYGTQIKIYGAKDKIHGIAAVSIDGGHEKYVDLYSSKRVDNSMICEYKGLKDGMHTVKVRVTGKKNFRSRNYYITADRAEITCTTQPARDTQAPTIPAGLTATVVSRSQINLNWAASIDNVGVKGYKVYRNGKHIGTVNNGTSYNDKGLHQSTTYSYNVCAYDAAGNYSDKCPAVSATTQQTQQPQSGNLALNKPASSDSEQPGYNAFCGNDGNLSTLWCAADGNPNHWLKVDLGGYFNLTGSEVTWQFGQKTYGYKIEVSNDNVNWYLVADKTNNTSTQITQTDSFTANSARFVRLTVTAVPSECWAAIYEFKVMGAQTITPDTQAPSIPSGLSASAAATNKINLNWSASSDNTGVTGYKVFRNGVQIGTVKNSTSYSDSNLTANTTYSYTVSAYDAAGNNSAPCPAVNATTLMLPSSNISERKAASSDSEQPGYNASYGNDGSTSTMWCASDGNPNHWWQVDLGTYYNLVKSEVTWQFGQKQYKYKIEVSQDNVNWVLKVDKTNNTNTDIKQTDNFSAESVRFVRITVTGVPSECWAAFYEFKVYGSGSSSADLQAPTVPQGLNASAVSTTQINLNWTASADNVGVTGYKVYRNDKQIGTVTNATSYTDTGLTAGTTYSYKVSAFDAAGNNSAKSSSVSAATQAPVISNLAFNKAAYTDSQQSTNTASRGNDGSLSTRWCAADGNAKHWWTVDLGASYNLTGTEVTWEFNNKTYGYKIEVSNDNVNWTVKADRTHNSRKEQTQKDNFSASQVRYVRITVTDPPSNCWASFYEFKVFGYPV